MATIDSLRVDLEELNKLELLATRQRTKGIFDVEVQKLESEINELEKNKAEKRDNTKEGATAAPKVKVSSRPQTSITTYGWDQSDKFMKLYITMNGVQNLPKDNITCQFTETGVDLRVSDFNNKDHRLFITRLTEKILPDPSYFKVKTDMILVMMKKDKAGKTWAYVTKKEDKKKSAPLTSRSKGGDDADGDGLMNMLQQMYDDGDDEMKRTIQKSWHDSQNKQGGGGGSPSGMGAIY